MAPKKAQDLIRQAVKTATIRAFLNTLAGRNVSKTLGEQYQKIMNLPYVVQQARKTPKDMSAVENYIRMALKKKKEFLPALSDFQEPTMGHKALLGALTKGQEAVRTEGMASLKARLGLGGVVAVPAVGAAALSKEGASEDVVPEMTAGAMGAAPFVQGLRSGALTLRPTEGPVVKELSALQKMLKPGDILLESGPGLKPSAYKPIISMLGADPYGGYHVSNIVKAPKGDLFTAVESGPTFGAAHREYGGLGKGSDYVIKRFKDPRHTKEFIKNLNRLADKEDVLREMLSIKGSQKMYDRPAAIRAGVGSLMPASLNRLFHRLVSKGETPETAKAICSSLTGMSSPVPLQKGIPGEHILPHHILRSPELKTPGRFQATRTGGQKIVENLLRASPWLLRGALGAGLGYGTYRGLRALMD